jgi:hypothetical protein
VSTIEKLLDDEREKGATKFNSEECKEKQVLSLLLIKIKIVFHSFKISWAACFALATDALDNKPV